MSERPFMQLYVSDFIGDTLHLSTEQIGAYMLLLMAMWNARGMLSNEDQQLARITRVSVKRWHAISPDLMPFFECDHDHIWHGRLTKELQKSERKSESRASAGARGGAAKALKTNDQTLANASGLLKHLPDTITRKKDYLSETASPQPTRKRKNYSDDFVKFWSDYPTDSLMSKSEAFKAWGKLSDEDRAVAIAAIPAFKAHCRANPDYRPVHACRFLTQRRFDGFAAGGLPPRGDPLDDPTIRAAHIDQLTQTIEHSNDQTRIQQARDELARLGVGGVSDNANVIRIGAAGRL